MLIINTRAIARVIARNRALEYIVSNNINIDNITDDQIINHINNGCAAFGLLFEKQSVEVQIATFKKSPDIAKLFYDHCEELKTLILFK